MRIVFPRTDPDLDGVACAVAYAELLQRSSQPALAWIPGEPDTEAQFALQHCAALSFADARDFQQETYFIYVDASGLEGLPSEVDICRVIEVVDHRFHGSPHKNFPNANIVIEPVGAAATMIVEKYSQAHLKPSLDAGRLLFGAIHSNTQQLKGSVTTARDRDAVQWLEHNVEIPPKYIDEQFHARRADILRDLESFVWRESKTYEHTTGAYIIAQLEFLGASEVAHNEHKRLISILAKISPRAMLNLVDVSTGSSCLIVPDPHLRQIISCALRREPIGTDFEFVPGRLRKQIVAALELA